jgi:hypothetical protein
MLRALLERWWPLLNVRALFLGVVAEVEMWSCGADRGHPVSLLWGAIGAAALLGFGRECQRIAKEGG